MDLVLNMIYIPKYGAAGAAVGTLAAEIVVLIIQAVYLREMLWKMKGEFHWKQIGAAVVVSTAVIWLVRRYVMIDSIFLTLVVSAVIYFGAYGAVLLAVKEPFMMDIVSPVLKKIKRHS